MICFVTSNNKWIYLRRLTNQCCWVISPTETELGPIFIAADDFVILDSFKLYCDLPGLCKEDIDVHLEENMLCIVGDRQPYMK